MRQIFQVEVKVGRGPNRTTSFSDNSHRIKDRPRYVHILILEVFFINSLSNIEHLKHYTSLAECRKQKSISQDQGRGQGRSEVGAPEDLLKLLLLFEIFDFS